MNIFSLFIFLVVSSWSWLLHLQVTRANGSFVTPLMSHERTETISIGAIFDETSRPGKEAKVAMEMVIHDFNAVSDQHLHLHFRNSRGKPVGAALSAKNLIAAHGVQAILGAHKLDEASAIAEAASEEAHNVPLLSFADLTPTLSQEVQINALAAIIQSWGLNQVALIYENAPDFIISKLSQSLRESSRGEGPRVIALTSFYLDSLPDELNQLKKQKCRIFVIHATLESGYRLYQSAKKLNMTGDGYAWIATNSMTDFFHSVSPKNMSLMQGVIGTKTYFEENSKEFQDFRKRFRLNFRNMYPDEECDEPGIFASQAYNAIRGLLYEPDITNFLQRISAADFNIQSSESRFSNWKIAPVKVVEIVNVVGKSYQGAYWTEGLGFSETIDDEAFYHTSLEGLKEVLWPAQPWHTDRWQRRMLAGRSEPIRVGVPAESLFRQFVNVETDPITNVTSYDGFSIKLFEEAMRIAYVNKDLTYNYTPFVGEYNVLVEQIALGKFDAVAGDLTISEEKLKLVDFSQPYTESGLVLIVPIRSKLPSQLWLFMKPFTTEMWGLIIAITVYNGLTVWLIERNQNDEFRSGNASNQIGTLFWLSFSTLFTLRGDRLHSNLSRMAMVVWLFVALIITQSYTASLASMLTAQRLEPAIKDVETLKRMNATVGYCRGSFLKSYLISAFGFNNAKINKYNSTGAYARALNTGEIAGIFLEVASAKVFLAQYCKSFTKTEKIYKVGGLGFAFEKDFPMLPAINRAIMNITESGKLLELEDKYINSEKCVDADSISNEDASIGLDSFSILFGLTGCTSTVALATYFIRYFLHSKPEDRNFFKRWRLYGRQSSARVTNVDSPRNSTDAPYSEARHSFSTTSDVESLEDHRDAPHHR